MPPLFFLINKTKRKTKKKTKITYPITKKSVIELRASFIYLFKFLSF